MRGRRRGAPGDFATRLDRTEDLIGTAGIAAVAPLRLLAAVLRHQAETAASGAEEEPEQETPPGGAFSAPSQAAVTTVAAGADIRLSAGRFPLLDLGAAVAPVAAAIPRAVAALDRPGEDLLPDPLAAAGRALAALDPSDREALVEAWLEDPIAPEPRFAFWARVAAGPVLETARAAIRTPSRDEWTGSACPACGGVAQASVIAEESGEFMGGSPRSLVCGRCAGWWTFPRAICSWCGEDDPRKLSPFVPDARRWVRVDACDTCGSYVKTFDLREPGGVAVVPLVDDVATVSLDVWAHEQGLHRALVSLAGV